ncbi:MAG: hypothetical protein O7E53_05540 [Alphaproteobacteria bacterium]|nr:hypothetical protein [Alphaproteobacteria bacterium]
MQRGDVVDVASQSQDDGFNTVDPGAEANGDKDRPDVGALESGAYGELMRRANEQPLSFSFIWRGTHFKSMIERNGEGMRLSLSSDLADIPFSVENASSRGELLAFGGTFVGENDTKLTVVQGRTITIEHEIALPEFQSDTMAALVTQMTMLVLNSAPYLDLIAECAAAPAEA